MKKLMIVAAVALAAVATQAAQFSWMTDTSGSGKIYYGSTAIGSGVDVYLFDAAQVTREACIKAIVEDMKGLDDLNYVSTAQTGTSKVPYTEFNHGTVGSKYDFYFATVKDGDVYLSTLLTDKPCPESGSTDMSWADVQDTSKNKTPIEFVKGQASYAAGWYTAAAVPEPTSGLLLLLGVAGLALRRRRA